MSALATLWMKDLRAARSLRRLLSRESRFKIGFVALFAAGIEAGLFLLFLDGFDFLDRLGGISTLITRRLYALFFLGMGIMLALSNVVTSYSTVFRSRETPYLLVHPIGIRDLITYKYVESAALSSWAFFFIVVPFAGAYAWHDRLGPAFLLWTFLFSIPFLLLCGGAGALLSLAVVRWLPTGRAVRFGVAAGLLAAVAPLLVRRPPAESGDSVAFVLARVLPGLQLSSSPFAPSWWTAEGIMALAHGQVARGLLLGSVLVSNALVVGLLVQALGGAVFYSAFQRVAASGSTTRRRPEMLARLDRALGRLLPRDGRGMVMKDIRTFLRDPMQWSQALIFFGLLGLYFASMRSFRYDRLPDEWRNTIVFLNIFSVASVVCSLAARFVYPQLSLEGQAFWMLGLAPTSARRVLLTKYLLAVALMTGVSAGLMGLAVSMLRVEPLLRVVATAIAAAIAVAACGLSTGLGAVFLNLKQSNTLAIVSGFGGTLNLVLSLGFMLGALLPSGLMFHWRAAGHIGPAQFREGLVLAMVWLAAATVLATVVPLWLGIRSLTQREY